MLKDVGNFNKHQPHHGYPEIKHCLENRPSTLMVCIPLHPGWWFEPTPLKNHGVNASWDDDIPNIWK